MDQSLAIWLVIGLALAGANLPFVTERPLLMLPWTATPAPRAAWLGWAESLAYFIALVAVALAVRELVAGALLSGGTGDALLFMARLLGGLAALVLVLAYPGWRARGPRQPRSLFTRLLEVLACYGLLGVLAFALEANLGSTHPQTWEFYAITLSLFLVLGYPGFVYRYLLGRRRAKSME